MVVVVVVVDVEVSGSDVVVVVVVSLVGSVLDVVELDGSVVVVRVGRVAVGVGTVAVMLAVTERVGLTPGRARRRHCCTTPAAPRPPPR